MTLVELARGHLRGGDKWVHTARAVDQDWSPEHGYLVGKFGNGYMRKALACYGMEWNQDDGNDSSDGSDDNVD